MSPASSTGRGRGARRAARRAACRRGRAGPCPWPLPRRPPPPPRSTPRPWRRPAGRRVAPPSGPGRGPPSPGSAHNGVWARPRPSPPRPRGRSRGGHWSARRSPRERCGRRASGAARRRDGSPTLDSLDGLSFTSRLTPSSSDGGPMILRAATFALAASCSVALPTPGLAQALSSAAVAPREAVMLTAVENMYSGPDAGRDVVSQALLGQVVQVIEARDGFVRVETPDRYQGWVPAGALLTYDGPRAPRYARTGQVADVTSLMANLYRDPSVTTARPKAQAPLGARLEVLPAPTAARPS